MSTSTISQRSRSSLNHHQHQRHHSAISPPTYSTLYPSSSRRSPQPPPTNSSSNDTKRASSQHTSQQDPPHPSSRSRRHRRSTHVQPDLIDRLDDISGFHYHHEGPFDAACREKNRSSKLSPIQALKTSNEEALKATPPGKLADTVWRQRPLDGVAFYPPGTTDPDGHRYDYEEGWNMMTEDRGNFKRWPGMKFRDEDFKNDPGYLALMQQQPRWKAWGLRRRKRTM
ncbi:hypothetical protein FQN50_003125 [Emmonsiellopsis sp. PD_5]|nr:hypothetical protein FQN50_003125 [Emmonsiellopsis sp. PD_5]